MEPETVSITGYLIALGAVAACCIIGFAGVAYAIIKLLWVLG
jgi:hypothetical protein